MSAQGPTSLRQESTAATALPKIPSGICGLDEILHGGFPAGRTTLIGGGPGTGKTLLGLEFLYLSALAGQAGIFVSFEERADAIRQDALALGWDLASLEEAGRLEFLTLMPEAMGAEQHLARALTRIEAFQPDHVVVDAISATLRRGADQTAFDYLMRLVDACKQRGITSILTNQLNGNLVQQDLSGIGFSSLIDALLLLQFTQLDREIVRSLLVLKSRGSKPSQSYHPLLISDQGVSVTEMPGQARPSLTGGRR